MKVDECPACVATEMIRYENRNFDQLTSGVKFCYDEIYYKYNSCSEEGGFLAETDKNYINAKNTQLNITKDKEVQIVAEESQDTYTVNTLQVVITQLEDILETTKHFSTFHAVHKALRLLIIEYDNITKDT